MRTRYVIKGGKLVCLGYVENQPSHKIQIISDTAGYDYVCPVDDDTYINSRTKHRENLKRNECRILEKGEKEKFLNDRHQDSDREINRIFDRSLANG